VRPGCKELTPEYMMCVTSVDPYWLGKCVTGGILTGSRAWRRFLFDPGKEFRRTGQSTGQPRLLEKDRAGGRNGTTARAVRLTYEKTDPRIERDKADKIRLEAIAKTPRIANLAAASTPRSAGIGAGARSSATPRRRGGGI
jgi:pre-mRNA-splicing factor ATP-dependent RNA helicase DHX38/PRP16